MSTKELLEKVKSLGLPKGEYALFGSAPLGVRGIKECNDVDLIVTDKLWDEYNEKEGWIVKEEKGKRCLINGEIEMWKTWIPGEWDIKKVIREAEIIGELPFVRLEEVMKWKKLFGRDKDLKDLELIENYLKNSNEK